jgi:CD109 antigen
LKIQVNATGNVASDGVEKFLKVIPEGVPKTIVKSVLVMKNESASSFSSSLRCDLPTTAVNDTTSAAATVAGDLMGPMINGIENLIQMSYGCGEQNLINFVPSLYALRYLESTGKLTSTLRAKALSYAEDGYQRQLDYRHPNGGFSAFGTSDGQASTWLTAFSVLAFDLASDYITIDQQVLKSAFDFFISKQNTTSGAFREDGRVIHREMQGGSSDGLPMTAFVSMVLSLSLDKHPEYTTARNKALDYLAQNVDLTDIYAVCISTLALQLGNHASFPTLYAQMIALGVETGDQMSWTKPSPPPSSSDPWWYSEPKTLDIEMTSYATWVMTEADLTRALKAVKWLVSKKNAYGGYGSTQDTVQALNALSIFGAKYNAKSGTLNLRLTPNLGSVINAQVNSSNMLTVQEFALNPLARQLDVFSGVNSTGNAIVSLVCNFYEVTNEAAPRFTITTTLLKPCLPLVRQICISYIARGDDVESNMALVKVTLPSGFIYDNDQDPPPTSSVS